MDSAGEGLNMKYFVLNPNKRSEYGRASREAIRTYAIEIHKENPALGDDLLNWIDALTAAYAPAPEEG